MDNVLVTGGSRGVGLAIAQRLVRDGYRVIAVARSETRALADAMRAAEAAGGGTLHFVPFDLGAIDAIPDLVKRLRKEFGPLYGLVNNAAIGTEGLLATMPPTQIEQLIRINVTSPIILTRAVVRTMMADGRGRIVGIGSIVATTGYKGLSVYAASKSSLIGFTRSLAREVGPLGITVNAVAPGFMMTEMTDGLAPDDRARIARRAALRRLPEVEDVGASVAYLLSEAGRNITGTVLTVDAGATA